MVLTSGVVILIWSFMLLITLVSSLIIFIYLYRKIKSIPFIPRTDYLEIFGMEKFVGGLTHGWIKQIRPHPSGRCLIDYYSVDYSDEELKNLDEIPLSVVIAEKLYIVPKGKHSKSFNVVRILPKNASELLPNLEEFPSEMKRGFLNTSIESKVRDLLYDGIIAGDEALTSVVKDISKGELSRESMLKLKGIYEEKKKAEAGPTELNSEKTPNS